MGMSKVKLVLTDLDGTAVYPEAHEASKAVMDVIHEAESRGVRFCAVTGRPLWQAKELLKLMGFKDACILDGGASIINPLTEETLWSRQLPSTDTKTTVEELLEDAFLLEYDQGVKTPEEVDLTTITEPALSVWASVPSDKAEALIERLRQRLPNAAVHGNPSPGGDTSKWGIQVTHKEADKEHAVKQLLTILGVDKSHTLAIGDGNNDLPLFNGASIKVAMGNATDLLKANADYVVGTVEEDGFANAIRTLVL